MPDPLFFALIIVGITAAALLARWYFQRESFSEDSEPKTEPIITSPDPAPGEDSPNGIPDTIPEDMPHRGWLENAGVRTWDDLENQDTLEDISHIGPTRAAEIREFLAERYPASTHIRTQNTLEHV